MIIAFLTRILRGVQLVIASVAEGAALRQDMIRRHPHLAQGE